MRSSQSFRITKMILPAKSHSNKSWTIQNIFDFNPKRPLQWKGIDSGTVWETGKPNTVTSSIFQSHVKEKKKIFKSVVQSTAEALYNFFFTLLIVPNFQQSLYLYLCLYITFKTYMNSVYCLRLSAWNVSDVGDVARARFLSFFF